MSFFDNQLLKNAHEINNFEYKEIQVIKLYIRSDHARVRTNIHLCYGCAMLKKRKADAKCHSLMKFCHF